MNTGLVPTEKMRHNPFSQVISPERLALCKYPLGRIIHSETSPPGTHTALLAETGVCSTVPMILNSQGKQDTPAMCLLASRAPHPAQCQAAVDAKLQNLCGRSTHHAHKTRGTPFLVQGGSKGESRILPDLPNLSAARPREARFPKLWFCSAPTQSSSPGRTHSITRSWTPTCT